MAKKSLITLLLNTGFLVLLLMLLTANKTLAVSDLPDFVKAFAWESDLMEVKQKYNNLKYESTSNWSFGKVVFYSVTQKVNIFDKVEERKINYGFLNGKLVCIETLLGDSNNETINEFNLKNGPPDKVDKGFFNHALWSRGETVITWNAMKMNIPFVNVGNVQLVTLSYQSKKYHDLVKSGKILENK